MVLHSIKIFIISLHPLAKEKTFLFHHNCGCNDDIIIMNYKSVCSFCFEAAKPTSPYNMKNIITQKQLMTLPSCF